MCYRERSFTSVDFHVENQVTTLSETFTTYFTEVRLLWLLSMFKQPASQLRRGTLMRKQVLSSGRTSSPLRNAMNFFAKKSKKLNKTFTPHRQTRKLICQKPRTNSDIMSQFNIINLKILEETVRYLKSTTCTLNIIPSDFLKTVESDLLQIVNS